MPPELRKRKAPASEPAAAPPAKKKGPVAKAIAKVKDAISPKTTKKTNGATATSKVAVGDSITLEGFGGEVELNDGTKTTLKALVDESKAGVVLFTYPKASTPGCTTQACLFRDSYTPLTATGFSIYGLSTDSAKANTNFKEKKELPYPLICDTAATLISAIGLKKSPSGTTRGVFVVDKTGKVLAAEPGSPAGTVEVVKKLVGGGVTAAAPLPAVDVPKAEAANGTNGVNGATKDDIAQADVAAQVADTAEKLDSNELKPAV
ncbi:AhpC-TSA-domain-containing protein [Stipitochalara longipes BDJ]|nr:AhpC-TSA-domain-containing protein [Stipitochalara longipes BDJ]